MKKKAIRWLWFIGEWHIWVEPRRDGKWTVNVARDRDIILWSISPVTFPSAADIIAIGNYMDRHYGRKEGS